MRILKRTLAALAATSALLLTALPAGAVQINSDLGKIGKSAGFSQSENAPTGEELPQFIGGIVKILLGILGIIFLILMVYAGFLWMTARGDSKMVDKAKDIIRQAIIGIIITTLAYAITGFVVGGLTRATGDGAGGGGSGSSPACTSDGRACTDNNDCAPGGICMDQADGSKECLCLA